MSFFARSNARQQPPPRQPQQAPQSPGQRRMATNEESRLTNLPEVEHVMDEIRQAWDFMTTEQFNPVHLALELLDGSSLGKDHYAFSILFGKIQKALESLVNVHYQSFNTSITTFSGVVDNIGDAQKRVQHIRANLARCKELLQAKRSDLLESFKKSLQYKEMIRLLDMIEEVKRTPERIESLTQGKYFLNAVRALLSARKTLYGHDLNDVAALSDLRRWLDEEMASIKESIVDELHNHLYLKSPHCDNRWRRYSYSVDDEDSFFILGYDGQCTTSLKEEAVSLEALNAPRHHRVIGGKLRESPQTDNDAAPAGDSLEPIAEDLEINPEEDSFYYMEILLESSGEIGYLSQTMAAIQQRLPVELNQLVMRTVAEVDARRSGETVFAEANAFRRSMDVFPADNQLQQPAASDLYAVGIAETDPARDGTLKDLIWTLYSKLNALLQGHRFVMDVATRICERRRVDPSSVVYSFKEVWMTVQSEVKSLLYDYLTDNSRSSVSFTNPIAAINDVLRDQKRIRDRNKQLFKLSNSESAHEMAKLYKPVEDRVKDAIKMTNNSNLANTVFSEPPVAGFLGSSFLAPITSSNAPMIGAERGTLAGFTSTGHRLLVKPDAYNMSVLFKPTIAFIEKVEEFMPSGVNRVSDFSSFLDDFILNVFLPQIEDKVLHLFYQATEGIDAFQVDPNSQRLSNRPLLKSATACFLLVQRLCKTLHGIPFHREEYVRMIDSVLTKYYEKCTSEYKALVSYSRGSDDETSGKPTVLSAQWAQERDIEDLLVQNSFIAGDRRADVAFHDELSEKEIFVEMKMKKDRSLHPTDLIFERKKLTLLGNIEHSLKWLAGKVWQMRSHHAEELPTLSKKFREMSIASLSTDALHSDKWSTDSLPGAVRKAQMADEDVGLPLSGEMANRFDMVLYSFQRLAQTCLFTLRIEFRCHCMYYLELATREGNYFLDEEPYEPDPYIIALNTDLVSCEEAMSETLPRTETRFIFDGLSTVMVYVLVNNLRYVRRLNRHGVAKMIRNTLALEQNLTNISGAAGEAGLERARMYYELFNLGPEGFVKHVRDHGLTFTFEQYKVMLDLIYEPAALQARPDVQLMVKKNEDPGAVFKKMYTEDLKVLMDSVISKH